MLYYKILVNVKTQEETDRAVTSLLLLGADGVEIKNPLDPDFEMNNDYEWDIFDKNLLGDKNMVIAYLNGIDMLNVRTSLDETKLDYSIIEEDSIIWENEWKKCLQPTQVGDILVTPLSSEYHILINPGSAFGTGSHETTKLCLQLLQDYRSEYCGNNLFDIGTGSAVLAIAASKLGAKAVTAVEIDRLAANNAIINISKNECDNIDLVIGDLTDNVEGSFSVVIANIIANAIIELSDSVGAYLQPSGIFISSGIIEEKLDSVLKALESSFKVIETRRENGWAAVVARKR